MGALSTDQSMEEILSSIKRIIADEDSSRAAAAAAPRPPRRKPAPKAAEPEDSAGEESVLELTEAIAAPEAKTDAEQDSSGDEEAMAKPATNTKTIEPPATPVLSDSSAAAIRQSLSSLSSLLVKPADAPSNTLEGLVQDMLRPMLKEWLDANLPGMVETMVKREIEKITGGI